ncbi:MAG: hypothetical protein NTV09_04760 [Bacteroidetes bacterium]|nr:hypothetical protein [Bacteroidota bacterium]
MKINILKTKNIRKISRNWTLIPFCFAVIDTFANNMLSPRRRLIIVISSVALGSLAAAGLMKQRFGTLKQENVNQLLFNFVFAAAIVIGIGVMLSKTNKKDNP